MYERVYCWLLIVLGVAGGACATYNACRSVHMRKEGGPARPTTSAGQCACARTEGLCHLKRLQAAADVRAGVLLAAHRAGGGGRGLRHLQSLQVSAHAQGRGLRNLQRLQVSAHAR